ncbi:MAG TPA: HAD family hydrolase [Candidatus Bathyarchaeia archaeon]|nr:HAD family hydrolase [Candidatus Bathyarchaeia archaeon]
MKGAIFDWDGTLAQIDDRELYCINQTLIAHHSRPIDREFLVKNYYQRAYETGTGPRMVLETALPRENRERIDDVYETYRKLFRDTVDKAKLQNGAIELLTALMKHGYKLGVATMRFTRSVVKAELDLLKVSSLVDVLYTREELGPVRGLESLEEVVEKRKQLVMMALANLKLRVEDAFLVGDSWWDVRAGKKLGIKTVLVRTGFARYNDFSSEQPDLNVASLGELRNRLGSNDWTL